MISGERILVTGVTGSGKSSTMAALINRINATKNKHIVTLENPIEFLHRDLQCSVTQREIGVDTDGFQSGLRAALRQDPDVIMIGELRDREMIQAALTAAETGHLVLATLHTNDAKSSIDRIVDVFPAEAKNQVRIQLASALGARVFATAGSAEKLELCAGLGAEVTTNYREQDFVEVVRDEGGADVILDVMGAKYLDRNLDALAKEGRLVIIGMQGGTKAELDIAKLMNKRGAVLGTTLRARPVEDKATICASVVANVWPLVAEKAVRAVVHRILPLAQAAEAHRLLESGDAVGKIVLTA